MIVVINANGRLRFCLRDGSPLSLEPVIQKKKRQFSAFWKNAPIERTRGLFLRGGFANSKTISPPLV